MKGRGIAPSLALALVAIFAAGQTAAQGQGPPPRHGPPAALGVPVGGSTSTGGTFGGTLSVQRFASSNGQIVAVGLITGTVRDAAGRPVGTLLTGPVEIPVTVSQGGSAGLTPPARVTRSAGEAERKTPALILVQGQQTCGVLHLDLSAITLNALGLVVTTTPITLDIAGDAGGPLGNLVCQILALLNNVVGVIGLLNQLLGVLGGLTGGLTGGLPI